MKTIYCLSAVFMACIIAFISCNTPSKQSSDSEDSIEGEEQVVTSDESEGVHDRFIPVQNGSVNEARRKAERSLAQANKEIEKEHSKIDDLFNRLNEAKRKLTDAEVRANKVNMNNSDHTSVQQEVESSEKALQIILDDVNSQYAKIYGFLLTVSNCEDLAEAVKDKVKSHIAVEILQKYKRKALEEIDNKYIGEP